MIPKRAAFITIGQSPRDDILDEMRSWWEHRGTLEIEQHGALDGRERDELEQLGPKDGEPRLVSRLRDGTEILLGAEWVHRRIQEIVARLSSENFDLLVLLCTGRFDGLRSSRLLVLPQAVVDHGAEAFASKGAPIGILVPHEKQMEDFRDANAIVSHASPYSGDRFEKAAAELEGASLIVLHCMGYDETMRSRMAEATGKPVLLARRMVASAIAQVV